MTAAGFTSDNTAREIRSFQANCHQTAVDLKRSDNNLNSRSVISEISLSLAQEFRTAIFWRSRKSENCVFDPSGRSQFHLQFNLGSVSRTATSTQDSGLDFWLQSVTFSGSSLYLHCVEISRLILDAGIQMFLEFDAGVQTEIFFRRISIQWTPASKKDFTEGLLHTLGARLRFLRRAFRIFLKSGSGVWRLLSIMGSCSLSDILIRTDRC